MKWNEVKIETASEAVEAIANILMEAGAAESRLKTLWMSKISRVMLSGEMLYPHDLHLT